MTESASAGAARSARVIALIKTPLNVLCLREALARLGVDVADTRVVVTLPQGAEAAGQLERVLARVGWADHVVMLRNDRRRGQLLGATGAIAPGARPETLILGNFIHGPYRWAADHVDHRGVTLIDDGASTIAHAAVRAGWLAGGASRIRWYADAQATRQGTSLVWPKRLLARAGVELSQYGDVCGEPAMVTWCSYHDVEVRAPDRLVPHAFEVLRAELRRRSADARPELTYFLGSHLVEVGQATLADHVAFVRTAVERLGPVTYLAHRSESASTLGALEAIEGLTVERPGTCVELAIGSELPLPGRVVAPWSSALETLALIHQDTATTVAHLDSPAFRVGPHAAGQAAERRRALQRFSRASLERIVID